MLQCTRFPLATVPLVRPVVVVVTLPSSYHRSMFLAVAGVPYTFSVIAENSAGLGEEMVFTNFTQVQRELQCNVSSACHHTVVLVYYSSFIALLSCPTP